MEKITIKQMKNRIDNIIDQLHRIGPGKEKKVTLTSTDGRWCRIKFVPKGDDHVRDFDVVELEFSLLSGWADYAASVATWGEDLNVVAETLRIRAYEGIASNFTGRLMELLVPEAELTMTSRHAEINIVDKNKVIFNTSITFPRDTTVGVEKFWHDNLHQAVGFKIAYTELVDDVVINP